MHKDDLIYPLVIAVFVAVLIRLSPALFYQPPVESGGFQVGLYTAAYILVWIVFLFLVFLTALVFVQYLRTFSYRPDAAMVRALLEGALKDDKAVLGYEKDPDYTQWEFFRNKAIRFSRFLNGIRERLPQGEYDRLTGQLRFTKEELQTIKSLLSELDAHMKKGRK